MWIKRSAALLSLLALAGTAPAAFAADLPEIRTTADNAVPACATPGRLMVYLRSRNKQLDPAFSSVATEYMRHGEALGLRWDYAFFQMMFETGYLTFTGDVKPDQNNFAGLGATGKVPGERFPDVSTGVKAHLQHLLMHAGVKVENPIAERTRTVQEWVDDLYKDVKGPRTFTDLAPRWTTTSKGKAYARDIAAVADAFYNGVCNNPDPEPQLVAEARRGGSAETARADGGADAKAKVPAADVKAESAPKTETAARVEPAATASSGAKDKRTAAKDAKPTAKDKVASDSDALAALADADNGKDPAAKGDNPVKILNPSGDPDKAADKSQAPAETGAVKTASAAGAAREAGATAGAGDKPSCRVFTASYGGQKAIIIKATIDSTVNYTVLDVNDGKEKREAEAYIAAYAKGGELVGGEFASQATALDKAFELCPDG